MEDNCFTTWISLRHTYIPSLLNLLAPPPHSTSLDCYRALGCTSNSHQLSISHVMYMFQCYCLYSSNPLLPPLCPQVHFYVHLHCCHENRFISKVLFSYICIYIWYIYIYISKGIPTHHSLQRSGFTKLPFLRYCPTHNFNVCQKEKQNTEIPHPTS